MAKNPEELKKVRDDHYKYTTEQFLKDVVKSPQDAIEAAWLWKNKEKIFSALKNRGESSRFQQLKKEMENTELNGVTRLPDAKDGEFVPSKFLG